MERYSRHLGAAIQVGIDAARHEVAMAEILETHGLAVMEGIEGQTTNDPRYSDRADYVVRQLKKAKVDEALLLANAPKSPPAKVRPRESVPVGGVPPKRRYARGWRAGAHVQASGRRAKSGRCYTCGSPLHIAKDCPKKAPAK